ncbi:MAG: UbiA family prenyltransferase [Geminicoccaceae bacterium]|nr:UbiA family prenyltransferase [Geminicoccaceae bacterium]MDW8124417.1 UbiA family prenyltransferase [Geminicoccaceae bacterium]
MSPPVWLSLGRVSNLPTVWTNALAGTALAGADPWHRATLLVCLALSSFYVGGMYLNDAFDAAVDRRERPERPIPSGRVAAETVFAAGFGWLLGGLVLLAAAVAARPEGAGLLAIVAGIGLAATIVFYDWHHKTNPLSPLVMGLCRVLAYLVAGLVAVAQPAPGLWFLAGIGLCWLVGLTYAAKQEAFDRIERFWPLSFLFAPVAWGLFRLDAGLFAGVLLALLALWLGYALWLLRRRARGDVPRAVAALIAGIALVDALVLAAAGHPSAAAMAVVCFALTLAGQRWIAGT